MVVELLISWQPGSRETEEGAEEKIYSSKICPQMTPTKPYLLVSTTSQ
jgi:hypothetical protein